MTAALLAVNGVFLFIVLDDKFRWVFLLLGALIMLVAVLDIRSRGKLSDDK